MAAAMLLLVVALVFSSANAQACTDGDMQLVGSKYDFQGNVQVCYAGVWGYVCHDHFDETEARIVCSGLGFSSTNARYRTDSYFGLGTGIIHMNYLNCIGSEATLTDCPSSYGIGVHYCDYWRIAGVFCSSGGECTNGDIRLAYLYNGNSYGLSEGRVEICYNDEWGTVCQDSFYYSEAQVGCNDLGYSTSGPNYYWWAYFGQGVGNIWLDELGCNGNEDSLWSCPHNGIGNTNCGHHQDIGIRCYGNTGDSCSHGTVRLWRGDSGIPENEGILQYCDGSTWTSMCSYSVNYCDTARLACQELGYPGAIASRWNGGFHYGYYYYNYVYYHACYSWHSTISSCYLYYGNYWWSNYCGNYYQALGVKCYSPDNSGETCTTGDVRLVDGNTVDEGRVEYCYQESWAPVCSLDAGTASLMCKKLGYTDYTWGAYFDDDRFGKSGISSLFNYIYCSSVHSDLGDCYVYEKSSGGCYITVSHCNNDYGLRCFNPGECKDGAVRLAGGIIEQEGRPEVCVNGVWGTVCQYSWNEIDGFVFCSQLGYDGPSPDTYYYSEFGESYGPIVWNYVYCNGWEDTIFECSKDVYPHVNCPATGFTAGISCREGCDNGDVRLLGGGFTNEGTVEVCIDNLWGLVADDGWTELDALVVCNQLGHVGGVAMAIHGSHYGKPNKTIHMKDVSCVGTENNLYECTKTTYSQANGKAALPNHDVAGVDCLYDAPTEPPCIDMPANAGANAADCSNEGSTRLVDVHGQVSNSEGRLEYCLNGKFTPICWIDQHVATAVCRSNGFTQYSWAAIVDSGIYGTVQNYSLVENITCTGQESSVSECVVNQASGCIPWCPFKNMGVRCFDTGKCTEGDIRLADGIIGNEGRVEICVNQVWGSVCDNSWDKTDAHVACAQLGHPDLEPIPYTGSYFGSSDYPIVYDNSRCGGWEDSLTDCDKDVYGQFTCTNNKTAGVLCGYDCNHGDVQLVGGLGDYEGTVQVCFDHLWGLISESGWSDEDAQVICRETGFGPSGAVAYGDSKFGKPMLTIHLKDVQCAGDEDKITDCTATSLSLEAGKTSSDKVASVKCFTPDECIPPSQDGSSCNDGEVRLYGENVGTTEGILQYCYHGTWSFFCELGANEALTACRQLGYNEYAFASIFKDGRFGTVEPSSMFESFDCSSVTGTPMSLSECSLADKCMTTCDNAIGITCYERSTCITGSVRLVDGKIDQEGRVEVCVDGTWGPVCGDGFDEGDAYVVCKQTGYGTAYPTVYTNSFYGDGDGPIFYSQMGCRGYESTIVDCDKQEFGSFNCERSNVVGITCQDNCGGDGTVRLVGGSTPYEGTIEVCFESLWGLITADSYWDNTDAQVICSQLNYTGGVAVGEGSQYTMPNRTVFLSEMQCTGTEQIISACDGVKRAAEDGKGAHAVIVAAGVQCGAPPIVVDSTPSTDQLTGAVSSGPTIAVIIMAIALVVALVGIVGMVVVTIMARSKSRKEIVADDRMMLSGIQDHDDERGVTNPIAGESLYDQVATEKRY